MHVAIVGAGPAGLSLAWTLAPHLPRGAITLFESGRKQRARICPIDLGLSCNGCKGICNVISGIGGCIHYGDSTKLSGYPAGRRLRDLLGKAPYEKFESLALKFFFKLSNYLPLK